MNESIKKRYRNLNYDTLLRFRDEGEAESQHLEFTEYGEKQNFEWLSAKLAREMCAFANSEGGIIIIGVGEAKEKKDKVSSINRADEIYGVKNIDSIIAKLEDNISSFLSKPIAGVQVEKIVGDKECIKIFVPSSLDAPHMVMRGNTSQIYKHFRRRGSASAPIQSAFELQEISNRQSAANLNLRLVLFTKLNKNLKYHEYNGEIYIENSGSFIAEKILLSLKTNDRIFSLESDFGRHMGDRFIGSRSLLPENREWKIFTSNQSYFILPSQEQFVSSIRFRADVVNQFDFIDTNIPIIELNYRLASAHSRLREGRIIITKELLQEHTGAEQIIIRGEFSE